MDRFELHRYLSDQLEMQILYEEYPYDWEMLDAILDLILDEFYKNEKSNFWLLHNLCNK